MSKKSTKKRQTAFKSLKRTIAVVILSIVLFLSIVAVGFFSYSLGEQSTKTVQTKQPEAVKPTLNEQILKQIQKHTPAVVPHPLVDKSNKPLPKPLPQEKPKPEIKRPTTNTVPTPSVPKPKLAIILDDVSFAHEVKAVKALGLRINMSFFPVASAHPNTAKLASREPFYLVHLPMEAQNFTREEPHTLRVTNSVDTISDILKAIKQDFPNVKYLNNHTGSKFTSDYDAVHRLYQAATQLGLVIVDSRTTAQTKLPQVYAHYGKTVLERSVFLDHEPEVDYICNQMKLAVKAAHEKGKAIAIGHPRPTTLKALKRCRNVFDSVQLVYLNEYE